jgi:hypothetical protein
MASAEAVSPTNPELLIVDSPYELARWRPLVNWILYVPHGIILNVLRMVTGVIWFIYWLILIITGRLNPGLFGFLAMYERYNQRAGGFLLGYTERYAPFDFDMSSTDNGSYPPIRVNFPEPAGSTSRVAALNFLLAIPHYLVLMVVGIGVFFMAVAGWVAVLVTGAWPHGMRDFMVRYANYYLRVWTYAAMVETEYPKFHI